MNDKELLELAAKAAGVDIDPSRYYDEDGFGIRHIAKWWNPIRSDGDALRLAVDLGLRIYTSISIGSGWAGSAVGNGAGRLGEVQLSGDGYADTRRAIVLAAAEIGWGLNK